MNSKRNGPRIIAVSLLLSLAIYGTLQRSSRKIKVETESPIVEAERIFETREKSAQQRVGGRLGILILSNRLETLVEGMKTDPGNEDWFQTLRALFISGKTAGLNPDILEFVLESSLVRFQRLLNNPPPDFDLYRAQIERLPTPGVSSNSRKILRDWALKSGTPESLRALAFQKLLAQDLNPEPAVLESMVHRLQGTNPSPEALSLLNEIRNPSIRKNLAQTISVRLKNYSKSIKPIAVRTLAKHIELIPEDYKKVRSLSARLIKSETESEIEAGIKAMSSILDFKKLEAGDAEKLRTWLKSIPDSKSTSVVKAGIKNLLVKIGGETN